MATYTKDQACRIVAGLASGKRSHHTPMSDVEFESRYDPQGYREKRIIALLEEIANALSDMALPARPEPRQYDRPARPIQPKSGPIQL